MAARAALTSRLVDAGLAAFVLALCLAEILSGQVQAPLWSGVLVSVLFAATMLTWRDWPFASLVACYAVLVLCLPLGVDEYDFLGSVVPAVLVVASVAAHYRLWPSLAGLVAAYAVLLATALTDPGSWLWGAFILGSAYAAGRLVRARALLIADLRQTTAELEASREQQAQAAVSAERTRIARELHDVVAHAVSVIVVQAGAAERMVAVHPDRASQAMGSVQLTGRQALVELRRMLGVLRTSDDTQVLGPQPDLADLDPLVRPVVDAGIAVALERRGDVRPLTAGLELAAYRILQEALTNVVRHAHATQVRLTLDYGADALALEVVDDGSSGPSLVTGGGHGLVGMGERVALYGGQLAAEPLPDGGFRVAADLPLAGPAEQSA